MPSSKAPSPSAAVSARRLFEPGSSPLVMGVLNVTPDSFYPDSRVPSRGEALERALLMVEEGADIIDVGGQSTRPGSDPVPEAVEVDRVVPVVSGLAARTGVLIAVDTDKARVARLAGAAGASVLNDVTALRGDPGMAEAALGFDAVILMHLGGGSPKTMQDAPRYANVVDEVRGFLAERKEAFVRAGGSAARVLVDPGIGFGKSVEHNLSLLKHIDEFNGLAPVVLGASRKSFLGRVIAAHGGQDQGPQDRLPGSLAVACWAALKGVRVVRVHDVAQTRRAMEAFAAVAQAA